jgi:hypothetical protein
MYTFMNKRAIGFTSFSAIVIVFLFVVILRRPIGLPNDYPLSKFAEPLHDQTEQEEEQDGNNMQYLQDALETDSRSPHAGKLLVFDDKVEVLNDKGGVMNIFTLKDVNFLIFDRPVVTIEPHKHNLIAFFHRKGGANCSMLYDNPDRIPPGLQHWAKTVSDKRLPGGAEVIDAWIVAPASLRGSICSYIKLSTTLGRIGGSWNLSEEASEPISNSTYLVRTHVHLTGPAVDGWQVPYQVQRLEFFGMEMRVNDN